MANEIISVAPVQSLSLVVRVSRPGKRAGVGLGHPGQNVWAYSFNYKAVHGLTMQDKATAMHWGGHLEVPEVNMTPGYMAKAK